MSGVTPPFPNTSSWRGAQVKHKDNFEVTMLPVWLLSDT